MFSLGASAQTKPNIFGATTSAQQPSGLFGSTLGPQPQTGTGLFATSTQQQPQQAAGGLSTSLLGASQQTAPQLGSIWQPPPVSREKSIPEQMQVLMEKWHPDSPNSVFQYYFYNSVPPDKLPYYHPPPGEDEKKWEEALAKKPTPNSIPVIARGFLMVAERVKLQVQAVAGLQTRLHQIDASLAELLQKHDLEITVRAAEAKRRHITLSHRCLALATKVQVFRNRGYTMSPVEEQLKKKLVELERKAFDPVVGGRQEEIWARMSGLRARAQLLQEESEKLGNGLTNIEDEPLDEEIMQKVKKILGDYDSQLSHLTKELDQIRKDFDEWENSTKPETNGSTKKR